MGVAELRPIVDTTVAVDVGRLVERLVPPPRFATATFDSFVPNPDHPTQQAAVDRLRALVDGGAAPGADVGGLRQRLLGRRAAPTSAARPGLYLDGGFGVGKTHLLAAAHHAWPGSAAYLTFAELAAIIGAIGMSDAQRAFERFDLICIDEFELDDVANTLMAVTFLRHAVGRGARIVATSNSLPDRLGEGRFAAEDFRREIAAIADHFDVVRVDGPDYRAGQRPHADPVTPDELDRWVADRTAAGATVARQSLADVLAGLRRVHPVLYAEMVEPLDGVAIDDLAPIDNQGDALLVVHLVDELYDAEVPVVATGCPVSELFSPAYRSGGYRKKYGRCESRLVALMGEAR